jgi:hypothetical protein
MLCTHPVPGKLVKVNGDVVTYRCPLCGYEESLMGPRAFVYDLGGK